MSHTCEAALGIPGRGGKGRGGARADIDSACASRRCWCPLATHSPTTQRASECSDWRNTITVALSHFRW